MSTIEKKLADPNSGLGTHRDVNKKEFFVCLNSWAVHKQIVFLSRVGDTFYTEDVEHGEIDIKDIKYLMQATGPENQPVITRWS